MRTKENILCKNCDKKFSSYIKLNRKFCSKKCMVIYFKKNKNFRLNLENKRFFRLLVLERVYDNKNNDTKSYWRVRCDCGVMKIMTSCIIRKSKSCGCYRKEKCGFKKGNDHFNWKGGIIYKDGYKFIINKEHPNSNKLGYIAEHILIMSNYLQRPLNEKENVHHKNGIKDDNRIENLELWSCSHPSGQRIKDKIEWCREW